MGQIITSLINFFLEVGHSGGQYKTKRNRGKALTIFILAFLVLTVYISVESFGSAFSSKAEVIKLRKQNESLQHLKQENDTLKIRNEILSSALANYLGQKLVDQLNVQPGSGLKDKLVETPKVPEPVPVPVKEPVKETDKKVVKEVTKDKKL